MTRRDMARPVEALRAMRSLAADGGMVIITDERVNETFTAPGDDVERFVVRLQCAALSSGGHG